MNDHPIGIFDSGIGGTSIWKEIVGLLPYEHTIYLADSKNAPYGEKSSEEILRLSIKNTELLLEKKCKLIVVACNTATTNAIQHLRKTYCNIFFIGIEPAIKPAALHTKSKKVGILATKGTLSSSLFNSTSQLHANGIEVIERQGKGLVELIENGALENEGARALLQEYLKPMLDGGIDYLVLGCTHYPYLIPLIREIIPGNITIIDSGEAVARQTKAILEKNDLLNENGIKGNHGFYSNLDTKVLKGILKDFKGKKQIRYLDF
ncbi:glutamate racemase [Maribacter sp. 2304DJ31-5]|uniref:glutamate racemase n=1 Tax=Maribacter sp. 2304DJ31-5 TaxID=3386273 RepID=UPI0039BC9FE3